MDQTIWRWPRSACRFHGTERCGCTRRRSRELPPSPRRRRHRAGPHHDAGARGPGREAPCARASACRLVGSFHTNLAEYIRLLSGSPLLARGMRHLHALAVRRLRAGAGPVRRHPRPARAPRAGHKSGMAVWPRGVDTRGVHARRGDRTRCATRGTCATSGRRCCTPGDSRVRKDSRCCRAARVAALPAAASAYRLIVAGDGPMSAELKERVSRRRVPGRGWRTRT